MGISSSDDSLSFASHINRSHRVNTDDGVAITAASGLKIGPALVGIWPSIKIGSAQRASETSGITLGLCDPSGELDLTS